MHGEIGSTLREGVFEFLDEQAFAAGFRERSVGQSIALRGHAENRDIDPRIQRREARLHVARLPHRERALARGDDHAQRRNIRRGDAHRYSDMPFKKSQGRAAEVILACGPSAPGAAPRTTTTSAYQSLPNSRTMRC
ncbi:hypothetical protein D3C83_21470 [compost metagenome]